MKGKVEIRLMPSGQTIQADQGSALRDALFPLGVDYPCGGKGECKGCRVKVLGGHLPEEGPHADMLSRDELAAGWRLSCQSHAHGNMVVELGLWKSDVLVDNTAFHFTPRDGYGIAIDLGTTTLALQLLDLRTGQVLALKTALNAQSKHGADIMSRIEFASEPSGAEQLRTAIREQLGQLIRGLIRAGLLGTMRNGESIDDLPIRDVVLVGNTAMHHLFCGIDIAPLAAYPFHAVDDGEMMFTAAELGWSLPEMTRIRFLPCLGGFVGSDLLAGILAVGLQNSSKVAALIDLGTNGEIVLGSNQRIICASTAAGPAFEGARIACGMRASTGAIHQITHASGSLHCTVIGGGSPRGICGSGLVDAVASALDLQWILPGGRLTDHRDRLELMDTVFLGQGDVRQLQLAKGAIAAGLRILTRRLGIHDTDVDHLYLAGAFGNYINRESARRIGLLKMPREKIKPSGNTALLGAKLALFDDHRMECERIRSMTEHVCLSDDPDFSDIYAEEMGFGSFVSERGGSCR